MVIHTRWVSAVRKIERKESQARVLQIFVPFVWATQLSSSLSLLYFTTKLILPKSFYNLYDNMITRNMIVSIVLFICYKQSWLVGRYLYGFRQLGSILSYHMYKWVEESLLEKNRDCMHSWSESLLQIFYNVVIQLLAFHLSRIFRNIFDRSDFGLRKYYKYYNSKKKKKKIYIYIYYKYYDGGGVT